MSLCKTLQKTPNELLAYDIKVNQDGARRSAYDLLSYKEYDFKVLEKVWPELDDIEHEIRTQIEIDALYAGYLERQLKDINAYRREENMIIPDDLNVDNIGSLSNEIKAILKNNKPQTLGAASRLRGMTPAALVSLLRYLKQGNSEKSRKSA